ncbi:MAG: GntR family transcriptional regulator [Planctomycetales bacterium]|nr:GntR family transcriptional regulator [Planctomycetales bacterium]MCA9172188.1 GntR family transcriptional regulator [Planctomycetales bacterium]
MVRSRTLLKDRAYLELKELIQSGEFAANGFLSERQLSERLGMSKTPIRAALEHLEAQGLVSVSPQQGIYVRELSVGEIRDLFDMRSALEPHVAASLARQESLTDLSRLRANLAAQLEAARKSDAVAATRLDIELHLQLAELCGNVEIVTWLVRCFDKLHRSILQVNRLSAGRLEVGTREHQKIVDLIVAHQADDAAEAMRRHLAYGRQFLLNGSAVS